MPSISVGLTLSELLFGTIAGVLRQVLNLRDNRKPYYGAEVSDPFSLHITGCLGELVVAKYLNVFWLGVGVFRGRDVDGRYEVRTSHYKNACLIVHPKDPDNAKFILVTGSGFKYEIKGWLYGSEAKQKSFWKACERAAYFVPQTALHPIETLEWHSYDSYDLSRP